MKRIFVLIFTFVFLLSLAPAASADVIVSPVEMVLGDPKLRTILGAVAVIAIATGAFLWITRKKK